MTGNTFTITYGKTGTSGQTQTKKFKDETACLKEAQKLLNEKLKKDYLEKKALKRIKISLLKRINPQSVSLTLKLRFPSREKMNGGSI
ncbi:WGR domain-containing protein [Leptospira borgpetersenii]|uniref:WGR domain-containing protein n=1 Tax=Leptospira borgpetersenii TaxID=174 RepID=UPI001F192E68|nr:WGR domain-containing protein [Leptospira borgpetersenii]